jgi:uncharacterized protein (TIGR01319 family)
MNDLKALIVEIGSTTTRASVVSLHPDGAVLCRGSAPTTVDQGDVSIGMKAAMSSLDKPDWAMSFGASSAAGGLSMSVHGLVYDMTVRAAKEAASGAGGNIKMITAGLLKARDLERLRQSPPKMILVAGGFDYGEETTALANAIEIAKLRLNVPVVYAGNVVNQIAVRDGFRHEGQEAFLSIAPNVYPKIDTLVVEPVRAIIHEAFERHIVEAPGMNSIRDIVDQSILPVPGAVMKAAELLYDVWGDTLVLDVGGATTDIHSVTEGSEEMKKRLIAPEPLAKRTVEGDLGVYRNKDNCVASITKDVLRRRMGIESAKLEELLSDYPPMPSGDHADLAALLCEECLVQGIARHAGRRIVVYGPSGRVDLAEGKDLGAIRHIVLTGGALTKLPDPQAILKAAWKRLDPTLLLPKGEIKVHIDADYVMALCGILAKTHKEAAQTILLRSLQKGTCHVDLMD